MKQQPMQAELSSSGQEAFYKTLKKRVNAHFKEKGIRKDGGIRVIPKTVFMLAVYFVPFTLILTNATSSIFLNILFWFGMGLGMAGLGLCVMHDANHGSFSKNRKVNDFVGYILNMLGGHRLNWRIQHNVMHHSYTNVEGMDEDISPGAVMRFSPLAEHRKHHKYQFIYAWFVYCLMTISWISAKDIRQILAYKKNGMIDAQKTSYGKELVIIIVSKVLYYAVTLVLPLIISDMSWYVTVLGFLLLHFTAGLTLASIFQPAHVMEASEYDQKEDIKPGLNNWAIRQLKTTTNYGIRSKWFHWFVGGLNFQIEHHLFPNISHVHYPRIANIVKQTALEFNLPYHVQPTFAHALVAHGRMLKVLGKAA